ncbi:MAG: hypothetical protein Kow00124_16910 [Anaerolineae bacterium]
MSYLIEQVAGEPIVIVTFEEGFDAATQTGDLIRDVAETLAHTSGPVYTIFEASKVKITFSKLAAGMADATRLLPSRGLPPRIQGLVVCRDDLIRLGARAINHSQGSGSEVLVFDTLDEALTHARLSLGAAEHRTA